MEDPPPIVHHVLSEIHRCSFTERFSPSFGITQKYHVVKSLQKKHKEKSHAIISSWKNPKIMKRKSGMSPPGFCEAHSTCDENLGQRSFRWVKFFYRFFQQFLNQRDSRKSGPSGYFPFTLCHGKSTPCGAFLRTVFTIHKWPWSVHIGPSIGHQRLAGWPTLPEKWWTPLEKSSGDDFPFHGSSHRQSASKSNSLKRIQQKPKRIDHK